MKRNQLILLTAVIVIILVAAGVSLAKKGESRNGTATSSWIHTIFNNKDQNNDDRSDTGDTNPSGGGRIPHDPIPPTDDDNTNPGGGSGGKGDPDPPPPPLQDDDDTKTSAGCYVGGCSGQICSSEPDVFSDCQWREEYACYRSASCERQTNGACGWTMTPELTQCLENSRGGVRKPTEKHSV